MSEERCPYWRWWLRWPVGATGEAHEERGCDLRQLASVTEGRFFSTGTSVEIFLAQAVWDGVAFALSEMERWSDHPDACYGKSLGRALQAREPGFHTKGDLVGYWISARFFPVVVTAMLHDLGDQVTVAVPQTEPGWGGRPEIPPSGWEEEEHGR